MKINTQAAVSVSPPSPAAASSNNVGVQVGGALAALYMILMEDGVAGAANNPLFSSFLKILQADLPTLQADDPNLYNSLGPAFQNIGNPPNMSALLTGFQDGDFPLFLQNLLSSLQNDDFQFNQADPTTVLCYMMLGFGACSMFQHGLFQNASADASFSKSFGAFLAQGGSDSFGGSLSEYLSGLMVGFCGSNSALVTALSSLLSSSSVLPVATDPSTVFAKSLSSLLPTVLGENSSAGAGLEAFDAMGLAAILENSSLESTPIAAPSSTDSTAEQNIQAAGYLSLYFMLVTTGSQSTSLFEQVYQGLASLNISSLSSDLQTLVKTVFSVDLNDFNSAQESFISTLPTTNPIDVIASVLEKQGSGVSFPSTDPNTTLAVLYIYSAAFLYNSYNPPNPSSSLQTLIHQSQSVLSGAYGTWNYVNIGEFMMAFAASETFGNGASYSDFIQGLSNMYSSFPQPIGGKNSFSTFLAKQGATPPANPQAAEAAYGTLLDQLIQQQMGSGAFQEANELQAVRKKRKKSLLIEA